jgi:hypothetical protein
MPRKYTQPRAAPHLKLADEENYRDSWEKTNGRPPKMLPMRRKNS